MEEGRLTLHLPGEWAALNGERLLNRVRGTGRLLGLDARIVVG